MQGARSGVSIKICKEEPRALYTHGYGHSINLAASDAIKHTKVMKGAMETAHEITKLVKHSPHWEQILHNHKVANNDHHGPGLRVLCSTCWMMRADSLSSIEFRKAWTRKTTERYPLANSICLAPNNAHDPPTECFVLFNYAFWNRAS